MPLIVVFNSFARILIMTVMYTSLCDCFNKILMTANNGNETRLYESDILYL